MTFAPLNSQQAYLPTSKNFYVNEENLKQLLSSSYTDIVLALNNKEIGQYETVEFLTGQQFFVSGNAQKKRQTFRKVFQIGAIASGATLNTAHGLTQITAFTRIYGTCITSVPDYRPIPYVSATAVSDQISIRVDATNIIIVNGATAPNVTSGIVVLEYLKS